MDKVIYTAIFGPYDDLKEPRVITPGWRYLCFTDQNLKSKNWEIIKRPILPEGATRTARYYKIMFHRHIEEEFSIWIDASFQINVDLNEWWTRFKQPVTCIQHPVRNCVYKEVNVCLSRNIDAPGPLMKQKKNYNEAGLPARNGLIASGILMRKLNQSSIDLCDLWYQQLQLYSSRDQIAFAYASWRMPVHHVIEWDYRTGQEFIYVKHLHKRTDNDQNRIDQPANQG